MRVAALFAGIGGVELGLSRSGHETLMTCEINEAAAAVLRARFDGVPNVPDVTGLPDLPSGTELVTAGFPCQDLSQAGRTAGIGGSRSGLVDHVFRLVDRSGVGTVFLENVSFMLRLDKGAAMRRLTAAFDERGYRWAYRVVNTLAWLPQRRERVYFVASLGVVDPAEVLFADDAAMPAWPTALTTHAHGFYWTEGRGGLGWAPDAVPTLKNGSTVGIASPPAVLMPDGRVIKPAIEDAERLQGFPAGWTEPSVAVERRARWRLVGNAVSVPAAEWLGRRLASPGSYDTALDVGPVGQAWPKAARSTAAGAVEVSASQYPERRERPPLHVFLQRPGDLLSARATRGFLSRTERGSLRFVPGFIDAVRTHLARMEGGCLEKAA